MSVYIIHENDAWIKGLQRELTALNVPHDFWFADGGSVDLEAVPPTGIFYNRMSPSSHHRGHASAMYYTGTRGSKGALLCLAFLVCIELVRISLLSPKILQLCLFSDRLLLSIPS